MLVLYVLFLAAAPLHVEKDCHHDGNSLESSEEEGHETHHCCSPFGTCQTCAALYFPTSLTVPYSDVLQLKSIPPIYPFFSIPEISFSIWQPPKLS